MQAAPYRDERLPRYTSYPTAPHFSGAVDAGTYADWLRTLPAETTASLYLHVPFCRSMCWYCGCHTTVALRNGPIVDYLAALRGEIALVAERLSAPLDVRHVHFGGGTPTILDPQDFVALVALLRQHFRLHPTAEIAVEIDPRRLEPGMIAALAEAGVNRASLGVQSFDPAVQKAINRIQTFEQTRGVVEAARARNVRSVNCDILYGLPPFTWLVFFVWLAVVVAFYFLWGMKNSKLNAIATGREVDPTVSSVVHDLGTEFHGEPGTDDKDGEGR